MVRLLPDEGSPKDHAGLEEVLVQERSRFDAMGDPRRSEQIGLRRRQTKRQVVQVQLRSKLDWNADGLDGWSGGRLGDLGGRAFRCTGMAQESIECRRDVKLARTTASSSDLDHLDERDRTIRPARIVLRRAGELSGGLWTRDHCSGCLETNTGIAFIGRIDLDPLFGRNGSGQSLHSVCKGLGPTLVWAVFPSESNATKTHSSTCSWASDV